MYDVGEIIVGCIVLVSAYALVCAVDFNTKTINKKESSNDKYL